MKEWKDYETFRHLWNTPNSGSNVLRADNTVLSPDDATQIHSSVGRQLSTITMKKTELSEFFYRVYMQLPHWTLKCATYIKHNNWVGECSSEQYLDSALSTSKSWWKSHESILGKRTRSQQEWVLMMMLCNYAFKCNKCKYFTHVLQQMWNLLHIHWCVCINVFKTETS